MEFKDKIEQQNKETIDDLRKQIKELQDEEDLFEDVEELLYKVTIC